MANVKDDRELSEAAFHSKYGFVAGWDEARAMVWSALQELHADERAYTVLRALYESIVAERDTRRDDYVSRIDV